MQSILLLLPIANLAHIPIEEIYSAFQTSITTHHEPTSFYEVVQHRGWCTATNKELGALEENETWIVAYLPKGKTAIDCKWLYKVKYKPGGSIDILKARLVILGCRQKYRIDYRETFAPIAKMTTIRSLLAIAAMNNWVTCQMDVTKSVLHGDLLEDIYMKFPKGYLGPSAQITCRQGEFIAGPITPSTKVYKLQKSLYGLKQAPRQCFAKLSSALISFGFTQSKCDYSLFTKKQGDTFTIVFVYVDDMLITGNCEQAIL